MITEYLNTHLSDKQKEFIKFNSGTTKRMLRQLDDSIISNEFAIGLPMWSKQDPALVRDFTFLMVKLNFGTTTVSKKYSRFMFNQGLLDPKLVKKFRTEAKLRKFATRYDSSSQPINLVKRPNGIKDDGLDRPGFMHSSKNPYKLDTAMIEKYRRPIKQNLIKSITKAIAKGAIKEKYFSDDVSYTEVVNLLLEHYMNPDLTYNNEYNVSDQRGRSIYNSLKRIGNVISSKDFRAMIVVPMEYAVTVKPDEDDKLDDIYYFIAELTGHKCIGGTEADKIKAGKEAYVNRELPKLDLRSEEDRKDLHELIWLERIYDKLDHVFNSRFATVWNIPLEIDHSMSLAQVVGALLNDEPTLKATSVIGGIISDPWYLKGVRRLSAKAVGTPTFYGSSQSAVSLLKSKNINIDKAEVAQIRKEFAVGRFAVLKQFKDLLIKNYNVHTPIIKIDTGITEFDVHVNKFKRVGTELQATYAYDSQFRKFRYSYTHEPILVPDYAHMKLFWATGLVHHLDSDLLEDNLSHHRIYWSIGIHDAILALPGQARNFRERAAQRLKYYNTHRDRILYNYRKSIGAVGTKADVQYFKLMKSVKDAGNVEFERILMK